MNTVELMQQKLSLLQPETVDIQDDSAQHAGHAGARDGGGHYSLRIISAKFNGMSSLARHRLIHATLGELMHTQIHALTIVAQSSLEV